MENILFGSTVRFNLVISYPRKKKYFSGAEEWRFRFLYKIFVQDLDQRFIHEKLSKST